MENNKMVILGADAIKNHLIDAVGGIEISPEHDCVFFDIGLHMDKKDPVIMRISLIISPSVDDVPFSSEESKNTYFSNLHNHMVNSMNYTCFGLRNWISGAAFETPKYCFEVSKICTQTVEDHIASGVLSYKIARERYKPSELDKFI